MVRLLYTLATLALLPWAWLHLLLRARRQPEYLQHWDERRGRYPLKSGQSAGQPLLWIHAVSVGETRAAQSLVAALRLRYPHHRILFTHMTPTGRATSIALFGDDVTRVYLPYDTPWAMRRFLRKFRPALGIVMETELWPNLVAACRAQNVPLLLVNARLSEKSAHGYARFPTLTRQTLVGLAAVAAQSEADAVRLTALGAQDVQVLGNLKFDIEPPAPQLALGRLLRQRVGSRTVLLAASSREGEEALILDAFMRLCSDNMLLLIVPRHPQRFAEVASLVESRGMRLQRRSDEAAVAATTRVWLGDSMGEMFAYYAACDIAFIGGSLLDYGSQNMIEACAVGRPVLIGPSTYNFAQVAADAIAAGAALTVADADGLVRAANNLAVDDALRISMAKAGRTFAELHRGTTERTLQLITRAMR
jgi:3-deoxy-D-manno-octulosonic-acid transferase